MVSKYLQYEVREKRIDFPPREHPDALPRLRLAPEPGARPDLMALLRGGAASTIAGRMRRRILTLRRD